jgi:hypothetical protein
MSTGQLSVWTTLTPTAYLGRAARTLPYPLQDPNLLVTSQVGLSGGDAGLTACTGLSTACVRWYRLGNDWPGWSRTRQ